MSNTKIPETRQDTIAQLRLALSLNELLPFDLRSDAAIARMKRQLRRLEHLAEIAAPASSSDGGRS